MLIICAITYMVVNKNIRIQKMKYFVKRDGILRITFGKIAVQIQVLPITPKAKFFWPVLVNPVIGASVKATSNIIYRNDGQYQVLRKFIFSGNNIFCK